MLLFLLRPWSFRSCGTTIALDGFLILTMKPRGLIALDATCETPVQREQEGSRETTRKTGRSSFQQGDSRDNLVANHPWMNYFEDEHWRWADSRFLQRNQPEVARCSTFYGRLDGHLPRFLPSDSDVNRKNVSWAVQPYPALTYPYPAKK